MAGSLMSSGFTAGFSEVHGDGFQLKKQCRDRYKWRRRAKRRVRLASRLAIILIFGALLIKGSVVEAFFVPSGSMTPTLESDDYILVEKLRYGLRVPFVDRTVVPWSQPERGDIVVFKRTDNPTTPADESEQNLVKRVIGVEGDIVELVGNQVFVNGELLYEPYAEWGSYFQKGALTFLVPEGGLFVLGDNRANSFDSRFWDDPYVAAEQVVGKASVVYWNAAKD